MLRIMNKKGRRRKVDKLLQHLSKGPTTIMIGGKSPSAQELGNQLTSVGFIFINLTETKEEVSLGVFVNQAATRLDEANFISGTGHVHFEGTSSVNYIPVQCIVEISLETLTGQALIYPVSVYKESNNSMLSENFSIEQAFSWGIDRIGQKYLPLDGVYHKFEQGGANVNVYLVDTGIDYKHDKLLNRTHYGYDVFGGDGTDEHGNGTFLAGIIAAIAPNANLYSVKVIDGHGNGSINGILSAIEWITKNSRKPAAVNIAIGIPPNKELDNAIRTSIASGISYVIEGGGDSKDVKDSSPSRVREGIIVGASNCFDYMADFSNFGEGLDIFAPGVEITSAALGNGVTNMSGVQVAAAHVTGVVALHLGQHPNMSPAQVKQIIVKDAVEGVLKNVPEGTPNRLLQISIDM